MSAIDITTLDHGAAERLDRRIRLMVTTISANLAKITELIEEAKTGQIHIALGFQSWPAYLADALGGRLELDTDSRREVVALMSGAGMSNRAIAQAVGVTEGTIRNDKVRNHYAPDEPVEVVEAEVVEEPVRVTGLDGKTYNRTTAPATTQRRPPLPDLFPRPVDNLRRVTAQIEKLCEDDRFSRNASSLSMRYVGEITRARDALNRILWKLDPDLMIGCSEEDDRQATEVVAKVFAELEQITASAGAAG